MNLDIQHIAEAFTTHKFAETFPNLAEDVKWDNIGRDLIVGREAVIARCTDAAKFLATVSTTFTKIKVTRAESLVIVEGECLFTAADNQTSRVASCDLFQFADGKLVELTSYVIDLNK
jgi:hypothetical protein